MIAAQQYYIDYGPDMILERLQSLLPSYIPDSCLQGGKSLNYWMQGVVNGHKKSYFVRDRVPPLKVKICIWTKNQQRPLSSCPGIQYYSTQVLFRTLSDIFRVFSVGERRHSQLR